MFQFFKNLFRKQRIEYLYFYILNSEVYGLKENIRFLLSESIQSDIKKMNKELIDYDMHTDKEFYESVLVLGTDLLNKEFFKPLLLEIYAYIKKGKDASVFSYKYTELPYKFLNTKKEERFIVVYKFKIKC